MTPDQAAALTAFSKARLDEDQATAKASALYGGSERWRIDIENCVRPDPASYNEYIACGPHGGGLFDEHAAHIKRYDPARALREVDAKRARIRRYELAVSAVAAGSVVSFIHGQDCGYAEACLDAVQDDAVAWSDHPDYRDDWRPQP